MCTLSRKLSLKVSDKEVQSRADVETESMKGSLQEILQVPQGCDKATYNNDFL